MMYKRANGYDQEHYDDEANGTDAALIDSYFLPGGILDPEETSSHNLNRPHHGTEATNGYKKDSESKSSGVCIVPSSRVMQSKLSSGSTSSSSGAATEGRVFGMSLKSKEVQGQRTVVEEEEYLLGHNKGFPDQNSRHNDNFLNNDLLRSQLEQLTVGHRSLDYQSHVIQRPNSLPIGSGNHREGVSALDPLADSVVGEVGGRPIINASVSQTHPTSSLGLPSPFAIDSTKRGIQRVTPAAGTGATATASTDPVAAASASTCSTAAFGNFSSDWFSSRPTSTANNIPQVGVVQKQEDFSNFLRLALPNRDGDLNAFGSSSSVASDTKSHSSFLQRHGENIHGSVMSNHAIKTNPWNVQDDNYEKLANIISDSQSSSHRPSHITRDAHNATTSLLATKAPTTKSSLPPVNNSSYFVPTGDHRVSPPPGFLSSSSPSQPVTSTVQGKSSIRETFHQDDDAARIVAGTLRDGALSGRGSKSAQELRSMPFSSDQCRQPDAFDECPVVLHPSNVVQSPFRRHVEDDQQRHNHHHRRNQQPQGVQSSTKNQQQKVKNPSRHHNDGDYDLSSLNTKMSRDVPSTIYVEEDTLSISEDTLTVCADSVTEASLPNRSHGKVVEYDRNGMDAVQETDAVEKRSKAKRNRKKRSKKKHQVQESVASHDTSSHPDQAQNGDYVNNTDEAEPKSESEEGSKETKKVMKSLKETKTVRKKDQPSIMKTHANSRSSGTTTEPSSSAETILHSPIKKDLQHKSKIDKHHRRNTERRPQAPSKPLWEPWLEVGSKWCSDFVPVARNTLFSLVPIMNSAMRTTIEKMKSWFPKMERFWFLFPMCCVCIDLFFLSCAILCKTCGQGVYLLLMAHKLALMELVESDYTAICYSVIFFYPNIVKAIKIATNHHYYWYIFLRWLAMDRFFCRPITIKDTYLHNVKKLGRNDSAMNVMKHSLKEGNSILPSFKAAVDHIIKVGKKQKLEESERIKMANHILLILRRATPLIMILESHIHRSGFLVLMTNTERILFGYGLAVLRTGYLFSPLIWISWTVQLTIIMFVNSSSAWCYFILMLGLVSIRLSHYSAAVEDLDGVDAMNSYSTSKRRRMSAYSHIQYS